MNAFFVRANYGQHAETFRLQGFVAIGWFNEPADDYSDYDSVTAKYKEAFPTDGKMTAAQNVGQVFRFWNQIKIDDIIVSTYQDGRLLIGIVKGLPYFKKDDICPFYERIPVKWLEGTFNRKELSIPTQKSIRSSLTVFSISQVGEIARIAGINLPKEQLVQANTPIIEEGIIYEAIKEKLLHLDDGEFESFVSYILQSLGFDATQKQGRVGDGGIDFEGVLDVFGLGSVKLQVQVKRYKSAAIGEMEIRNFRGALKREYQGTFVTLSDFNKKAVQSAIDIDKVPINLVNGKKLIEIFVEQYDKVIELMEADENHELLSKLKFKRTIIPL